MASIAVSYLHAAEGMKSFSFGMSEDDLVRLYDAYKKHYMESDQEELDAATDYVDDGNHDRQTVKDDEYTMDKVFRRISDDLMYGLLLEVHRMETNDAVKRANVKLIDIKVAK